MRNGTHTLFGWDARDDLRFRAAGAVSRPVCGLRVDPKRAVRPAPRPAWMLLYALLPLCLALLLLADRMSASGGLRTLAEGVVVVLVIGLAAVWVRANRCALSRIPRDSEADSTPSVITLEVHDPSPRLIRLPPRREHVTG
ncbi:MAG TPA: hypothetical protein VLM91_27235 [Candidatus Methylomirabilis sp.]|nr:hypothetical protein [Candidatus Methylomirabilis sp.]